MAAASATASASMAADTTVTVAWTVSSQTTLSGNWTEELDEGQFLLSLALMPSIFAAVAVVTWVAQLMIRKHCNDVDPVRLVLRINPPKAGIRNGSKVSPAAVVPLAARRRTPPTAEQGADVAEGEGSGGGGGSGSFGHVVIGDDPQRWAQRSPKSTVPSLPGYTSLASLGSSGGDSADSAGDDNDDDDDDSEEDIDDERDTEAMLANLMRFSQEAEQRLIQRHPDKFVSRRGSRGSGSDGGDGGGFGGGGESRQQLRNKGLLKRMVVEELTRRGATFQFLNIVRNRDDFFRWRPEGLHRATTHTRQPFSPGRKILYLTFAGTAMSRAMVGAIMFLCYR